MECRLNKRGTAGYAPQLVNNPGDKMIRLQTNYRTGAANYRTAVYEIVHSQYTGSNPAITYAKHLPAAVKTFLLGEYGTQPANPQGRAWTIFRLGKLLFEGSKEGFEAWHEALRLTQPLGMPRAMRTGSSGSSTHDSIFGASFLRLGAS